MKCVDVLLPLHVERLFSYQLPSGIAASVKPGCRVVVPLGKSKQYTGIVITVFDEEPLIPLKSVLEVLDEQPFVPEVQITLWKWISSYYICFLGDVLRMALPSGLQWDKALPFSPRTERFVRFTEICDERKFTSKQSLLLNFLEENCRFSGNRRVGFPKKDLLEKSGISESVLSGLIKKGVLEYYERVVTPSVKYAPHAQRELFPLTEEQSHVYKLLSNAVMNRKPALLKGPVLSGKTEVSAHLIQDVLQRGEQVLYLMPDVKASSVVAKRFTAYFGEKAVVYHSGILQRERLDLWRYLSGESSSPLLIIGVRSALFLPFSRLGLIVVDEEHDDAYKQNDSAPRYHARNVALMLGYLHKAGVVLSSATPSIESYFHALRGKYVLAELKQRHTNFLMPHIQIENTAELRRRKLQKGLFSPSLLKKMESAFASGGQVLLFQNRKRYARVVECVSCGWTPLCPDCKMPLAYTKQGNTLICVHCGKVYPVPDKCAACGDKVLPKGVGTERVEEELKVLFPSIRVARVDGDTVESSRDFYALTEAFNEGSIDLIIGTQLLVRNIDFSHVRVVGVVNGDLLLNIPDFRAHEKAFQSVMQLIGLAGRDGGSSDVVIQTGQSCLPIIGALHNQDYDLMYVAQCAEREMYGYPPFTRLIRIIIGASDDECLSRIGKEFAALLIKRMGCERVCGPILLPEPNVRFSRAMLLLKIESGASYISVRTILGEVQKEIMSEFRDFRRIEIIYDVDPVSISN